MRELTHKNDVVQHQFYPVFRAIWKVEMRDYEKSITFIE